MSAHPQPYDDRPDLIETMESVGLIRDNAHKEEMLKLASLFQSIQKPVQKNRGTPNGAKREVAALKATNEALAAHTEMLACALGACPECFGMDPDCTRCAGEGRPGFFLPDELCFQRYVLPVIKRILREKKSPAQIHSGQSNSLTPLAPE